MKKHIYTFLLCLTCMTALGQDAPPSVATAISPNFTWYKKILLGDTSYYAYSTNNWVNFARRGWVQKSFMPLNDSSKYLKTNRHINLSPYNLTAGRIVMAGSVLPDLGGASLSGLILQSAIADRFRSITALTGSQKRWTYGVTGGGDESENGANSGSNFAIARYNDAGGLIDYPLSINRSTGSANFTGDLNAKNFFTPGLIGASGGFFSGELHIYGGGSGGPFPGKITFDSVDPSRTWGFGNQEIVYKKDADNANNKYLKFDHFTDRLTFGSNNSPADLAYLSDITNAGNGYAKITGENIYSGNQFLTSGGLFGQGFTINGNGSAIFTALNAATLTTFGTVDVGSDLSVQGYLSLKGNRASLVLLDRSDNTKEWQNFANGNQYVVFNQLLGAILTASYTTGIFNFSNNPTVAGVNIQTTSTADARYLQLTGGTLTSPLGINLNDIRTTAVNGLNFANNTAATSSIALQYSPRVRMTGSAWNTTTLAPVAYNFDTQLRPASASVNAANVYWSINNTDVLNLSQAGILSALGGFSSYSSGANSAFLNLTSTGTLIQRSVADANSVLTVNQAGIGSTGVVQVWQNAGSNVAFVSQNGSFFCTGLNNIATSNNASITVAANGSLIQRNVADANPALTVNNILGTGDIFRVQQNGSNKFILDVNGAALFSGNVSTGTRLSINSGSLLSAALYLGNNFPLTTSGSFGLPGFGIRQDALTYTSNAAGSTVALASANSFALPTFANTNATTLTNAATFYISGAPVAGANTTIGTGYALYLAGGGFYAGGTAIFNNTVLLNTTPTYTSGNYTNLVKNATSGRVESITVLATNTTTVSLSASTLNSTYPSAPDGFQVICNNITSGGAIYTKAGSMWLMTNATVQL